jgi:hypothetical protein
MKKLILASHVGCVFPFLIPFCRVWNLIFSIEASDFCSCRQAFFRSEILRSVLFITILFGQIRFSGSRGSEAWLRIPWFIFQLRHTRPFFSVFRFSFTSFGLPCFSSRKIFLLLLVLGAWTRYSCCALVHVPAATVQADFPCLSARWVRPWSRCRVFLAPQWLRSFLFAIFICACRSRSRPH